MGKFPFFVVLPASFVDKCSTKGLNLADAISITCNGKPIEFDVNVVDDDYFNEFYSKFVLA